MPSNFERDTWLAEVTGYDPNLGVEVTHYFSNDVGLTTKPTDVPANTFYDPRIKQPVNVIRSLFTGAATLGATRVGFGWLILSNGDGALDDLIEHGFDGRNLRILHTTKPDPVLADFAEVLKGTQEQPEFQDDTIRFKLRDDKYKLSVPLQPTKYTGAGLGTLEGVAGDLKGKSKPVCYGVVFTVPAPCVETAKRIYQVNDGAVNSVDAVYIRGVALINDGTYATLADLQNNALAPAGGHYKSYIGAGGSYFRLGADPDGLVTADVTEGATAADRTAAQIFKKLLARQAIVPTAGDITALDAANSSVIGFWQGIDETTIAAACDEVTGSVGAWWGVDRASAFRVKRFTVPTTSPVISWTADDFLKPPARLTQADETKGIPTYRVILRYQKNYAVQTSDVAAAVTNARRSFLEKEYRDAVATDAAVQTIHRLAPELAENTLLTVEANAQAEADRRQILRGTRRDRLAVELPFTAENAAVDLGDTVELVNSRYGGSNPVGFDGDSDIRRRYVVLSIESDADKRKLLMNLWGPNTNQKNIAGDAGALFLTDDGKYLITSPE